MADLLWDKEIKMLKDYDFMKPLSQQLNTVLPQFDLHADAIDKALPFYLAIIAKSSGKTAQEFFGYNMKALELIYGASHDGKNAKELAESAYAYSINAKAREIFDKLDKVEE